MRRRELDLLVSVGGVEVVVVLAAAGGLLTWAWAYANSTVHNQLAAQQIFYLPESAFAHGKAGHRDRREHDPLGVPVRRSPAAHQGLSGASGHAS